MTLDRNLLAVNEVFTSIQGEGPRAGQRSYFVRLQGCPVKCSWCDTKYTWHPDHITQPVKMSLDAVQENLLASKAQVMVLTGGEPLAFLSASDEAAANPALNALLRASCLGVVPEVETSVFYSKEVTPEVAALTLRNVAKFVEIRSSGPRVEFRLSPKLPSASVSDKLREVTARDVALLAKMLLGYRVSYVLKLVVDPTKAADLDFVRDLMPLLDSSGVDRKLVWLMPLGSTQEALSANAPVVADLCLRYECSYSHRLQVALFGSERGR